ncbi:MAG TPA: LuxR C-terminal-related transcriptional regulator [Ktedonobacteraceae bacterium]|nr:LuxR C-terminal-related transcriptional regulator [Ktedonobacteraceae bacterium]
MASQTLVSLVARLQQVMSVAQGRAMLLDYARKSCGARLALLFALDQERQVLVLLEHAGRHPHPSSFSPETTQVEISLKGLFASALRQQGFLDIPDISRNTLSLPEERACAWPHGRVLLHALRQGQRQGVLVFCFSPASARTVPGNQTREELLICISLLSAYLVKDEEYQPVRRVPASQRIQRSTKRSPSLRQVQNEQEVEREESPTLQLARTLDLLTQLSELGLLASTQMERQALSQHMLRLLSEALHAPAACIWRYQPEQQKFVLTSAIGGVSMFIERASTELASLAAMVQNAGTEPTYGLIELPETTENVLAWHTLRYREQLLGALGVVLAQELRLFADQRILLNAACHLMALILLHYDLHFAEQQKLLEQERGRIAGEIHDSIMQDVGHVVQKLEYIQRVLEKQPQVAFNEIEQARTILNRSLRDLRYGLSSLLPVHLEEQDFDEALRALLHEYSSSLPYLKITYDVDSLALWPQSLQAPVYRFLQEALNNIRKHASANEVHIRIRQVAGLGMVQVSDNGQGFVPEYVRSNPLDRESATLRMGLLTMEERIHQAGGILEIRSKPGAGTVLKARFPLTQTSVILTEREREVLSLLVDGLTNRAISERLSVSLETVKSHVHHIMQKMHVKDRTQAAVVATRQQWL